jgi:hypothetical protein
VNFCTNYRKVPAAPASRFALYAFMKGTLAHEPDRVQRHTGDRTRAVIAAKTRCNVREHADPARVDGRIAALEREWDVEKTLEANASTLALVGAVLGTSVSRKWFWLTGGVLGFLFQHASSGWCPPLPILRKLGVRTQSEIDEERYALKAIRGDFGRGRRSENVESTVQAVSETATTGREPDRVRRYTSQTQQRKLDEDMARRVRLYASRDAEVIAARIEELQREWSIERYLQINVAVVGLTTVAFAAANNRKWGYATCASLAFFLFHAIEGFDPPLPLMRKAGARSRAEINREIYALKIVRGDFDHAIGAEDHEARVEAALAAISI